MPSEPDRPRVMKLISRSRFLPDVGVCGVPGTVAGVSLIGRKDAAEGRDATESIDHREAGCEASIADSSQGAREQN